MNSIEQTIRERAYQLWVESGFEHGHAEAHWLAAQREVLSASFAEIGRVTTGNTTKNTRWRRKRHAA
jgi:Protein of unknown function (DUF2934)